MTTDQEQCRRDFEALWPNSGYAADNPFERLGEWYKKQHIEWVWRGFQIAWSARVLPAADSLCEDCPPANYPTDKTRCTPCPRRSQPTEGTAAVPSAEKIAQWIREDRAFEMAMSAVLPTQGAAAYRWRLPDQKHWSGYGELQLEAVESGRKSGSIIESLYTADAIKAAKLEAYERCMDLAAGSQRTSTAHREIKKLADELRGKG